MTLQPPGHTQQSVAPVDTQETVTTLLMKSLA